MFAPGLDYTVTNVVLEFFCAAVSFVLALHLTLSWNRHARANRLFAVVLVIHTVMLLCDSAAWILATNTAPSRGVNLFTRAVNFLEFSLSYVNLILITEYIVGSFSQKAAIPRRIVHIVAAVCLCCIALLVVSQFNGAVYRIDDHNKYIAGPFYDGVIMVGTTLTFFLTFSLMYYCRSLTGRDRAGFVLYSLFLALSSSLQLLLPDIMVAYASFTLSLLIVYVNVHVQQERRLQAREIELRSKDLELADARMSLMISQVQPHFLYNTLTVVSDLCSHDPGEAKKTIIAFSHYLRANLTNMTRNKLIPFDEELRHVDTYLSLEAKRFDERLTVEFCIGPRDFYLPPLTLQPIIENAVRHGITVRTSRGAVVVSTEDCQDAWRIIVADDGVGFDPQAPLSDDRAHVGIQNVRSRIEALCGGSVEVDSAPGKGTRVVIEIPKPSKPVE